MLTLTPPAKRKADESPVSVQRPLKVPRLNDNDRRDKGSQVSSDKRTNVATPLTQAPNIKKSRPSFLSQPTRAPLTRPGKGKSRASSPQSTSSLRDHISKMVYKQNQRFRRIETARKSTRKRRVTTSGLIPIFRGPAKGGSEVFSVATRVRRGQPHDFLIYSTP
ncbi:hypothetical protein K503DRAFT_133651 [Rhizopogon vinicolor AM-OR11-026]|uniref:Uncharacterized protein n=1 Tax=Rhizopogon vinicolor AM-OR11-026 TaxID=1314800 RepID=A0A1B7N1R5_9AGAM|nr:hypothetical protein K503DRAFT_133651 [Rhizopogon vinicolor AM-OR11-026]